MSKRKPEEEGSEKGPAKKAKAGGGTVIDKICACIRHEKNYLGSSRQAIVKLLKELYQYDNDNAVKKALKSAVEKKQLVCENKTRFKVAGEEYEIPASEIVDIKVVSEGSADGARAEKGDVVQINYIGHLLLEGGGLKEFERGNKFEFQVGAGDVIKGMDRGVVGARLHETRNVSIPSNLAYGKKGSGPDVPPESNLMFRITLVKISSVT
jgi:FKBP-type peptidyl-prolyl cis-trans isomerase